MDALQACVEMCLNKFENKCGPIKVEREMVRSRCTMGCIDSPMTELVAEQSANMIFLRRGCRYFEKMPAVVKPEPKPEPKEVKESEKVGLVFGVLFLLLMALPPMRAAAAAVMIKNGSHEGA